MKMRAGGRGARRWLADALLLLLLLASMTQAALAQGVGWTGAQRGQPGKDLNAVYFADTKRGWIAGDNGFVSYTGDGGRTWTPQTIETKDAINDLFFRNKDDGYIVAGNSIFSTGDGGRNWREIRRYFASDFGGAQPELYSVRFSGKKKGWVVGSISRNDSIVDSLVLYTNDGGASWQRQRMPTREELIHVDFVSEKRGWIVGDGGTILNTTDGGDTWTPQRSILKTTLYHVDFRNDRVGWAVGKQGTILRTTDGGETWFTVDPLVRNTLLSVQFVDENNGWIVGRGGVVLRSEDGGATWVRQESGTRQNLYALFLDKENGWAVGGDGTVLRYER
ncbi:MAG TPA: YCF48-related protein [Pyrinomonadaceae bacterium]